MAKKLTDEKKQRIEDEISETKNKKKYSYFKSLLHGVISTMMFCGAVDAASSDNKFKMYLFSALGAVGIINVIDELIENIGYNNKINLLEIQKYCDGEQDVETEKETSYTK